MLRDVDDLYSAHGPPGLNGRLPFTDSPEGQ